MCGQIAVIPLITTNMFYAYELFIAKKAQIFNIKYFLQIKPIGNILKNIYI